MKWVRVDVNLYRHPKFYTLPRRHPRAVVAWLGGLMLAGDVESDGFIPIDQLPALPARAADVRPLVDHGLWVPVPGGYVIHDFDEHQPVKKALDAQRERGRRAAMARWHPDP